MKHNMWPPEAHRASRFHYQSPAPTWLLTCSDEEDASAQEDVVGLVVNSAHPDAEPAQHQQASAEDGEHAGGADDTCAEISDSSELLEKNGFSSKIRLIRGTSSVKLIHKDFFSPALPH